MSLAVTLGAILVFMAVMVICGYIAEKKTKETENMIDRTIAIHRAKKNSDGNG